jgi:hypothetical protein
MAGDLVKFNEGVPAAFAPRTFDDAWRMATAMAKGGLFGCSTPEQAFSLMMIADAEGTHPVAAARDYHIIEGKPSLKADAMLARFQAAGGKVKWIKRGDTEVSAEFSHPQAEPLTVTWSLESAKKITMWSRKENKRVSITDKDNWRNFPRQMLAARVISEGVRATFPSVLNSMYTPEEVIDFSPTSRPPATEAAPADAGQHETPQGPPVGATVKSAYRARKDGDWEKVSDRLCERMAEFDTKDAMEMWWAEVEATDEEFNALPKSWRAMFRETEYQPRLEALTQ